MASSDLLVRKLSIFSSLSDADSALLRGAASNSFVVERHSDIIREGETPSDVHLIVEGFACRYKHTSSGARQIVAYLVPGDFADTHVFVLKAMDHSIGALSACRVVAIPRATILALLERPAIARAMWLATLVDEGVLREWIVNIGARNAKERIAHLMCELLARVKAVGLATGDSFELPITQSELGETMGLSPVHVNRTLKLLRADGLITFKGGQLVVLDAARLRAISSFNSSYLHLEERDQP